MSGKKAITGDQTLPVKSEFLLYQTEDGQTRIDVRLQDETVWMTQAAMAELYQTTPQNITLHLKSMYTERELEEQATCKEYLQVQQDCHHVFGLCGRSSQTASPYFHAELADKVGRFSAVQRAGHPDQRRESQQGGGGSTGHRTIRHLSSTQAGDGS